MSRLLDLLSSETGLSRDDLKAYAEHRGVAATDQAAARRFGCFQFHGSNSASRPCGMSAIWPSTSASQACGSTSLSLAVYADCRTMPNGLVFPGIHRERRVIGSA